MFMPFIMNFDKLKDEMFGKVVSDFYCTMISSILAIDVKWSHR